MSSIQRIYEVERPRILREQTIARAFAIRLTQLHQDQQFSAGDTVIMLMKQIGSESDCKPLVDGVKRLLSIDDRLAQFDAGVSDVAAQRQDGGKWAIRAHLYC